MSKFKTCSSVTLGGWSGWKTLCSHRDISYGCFNFQRSGILVVPRHIANITLLWSSSPWGFRGWAWGYKIQRETFGHNDLFSLLFDFNYYETVNEPRNVHFSHDLNSRTHTYIEIKFHLYFGKKNSIIKPYPSSRQIFPGLRWWVVAPCFVLVLDWRQGTSLRWAEWGPVVLLPDYL